MEKKWMILCVAGQSNAVGYDESPMTAQDRNSDARIAQLGLYAEDNLRVIPLGACAQNIQDMRPYGHPDHPGEGTKGIHLPLARLLLAQIPEDYGVLVIPCAYGGTGFTVGEMGAYDAQTMRPEPGVWRWGTASNYYRCMRDRVGYALDMNPENRFLGVVWCQGEHDSGDPQGQIRGFEAMAEDFFRFFGEHYPGRVYRGAWNRAIWYNCETVGYWYALEGCREIWANYRRWSPETYVEIPRDTDSNAVRGTGITARVREQHFGNDAYARVVAPRVAQAMGKRLMPCHSEETGTV